MLFCIALSVVYYLNVSFSRIYYLGWGRERESCFFCYRLLVILLFCSKEFPLPLDASERLRYFIVALPGPFINYFARSVGR